MKTTPYYAIQINHALLVDKDNKLFLWKSKKKATVVSEYVKRDLANVEAQVLVVSLSLCQK